MLACDKTVTLVRCDGEGYACTVIEGVSWFEKLQVTVQDTGLASANTIKVRIPAARVPADTLPQTGDILILGAVSAPLERPADLDKYRHAKIMGVGDNRRGRLPHLAVTCG